MRMHRGYKDVHVHAYAYEYVDVTESKGWSRAL
jgi:hypothetical protein